MVHALQVIADKPFNKMKQLSFNIVLFFSAITTFSQAGNITVHVIGNKDRQVWIDDHNYSGFAKNKPGNFLITDLSLGKHTLKMIHAGKGSSNVNSTPFTTRADYDMLLTVSTNGNVAIKETRAKTALHTGTNTTPVKIAMSDSKFSIILDDVRKQWMTGAKITAATNVFSNKDNVFSSHQARQIIVLVNGESNRLQLAKLSYRSIADPANFHQLDDLFTEQASKDELTAYVSNYIAGNGNVRSLSKAMSDASFNVLLKDVEKQWLPGAKMTSLRNAFANTSNFFNISQIRQLILLVTDESNRLQLAKSSYRSIIDTANFNQVYDLLSNQSSKDELSTYIRSLNEKLTGLNDPVNSSGLKTEMSEANFNALVLNIQNQWIPGSRMTAISNAFANTNNYFSVIQARQLIQYVTDETNRLKLAKLSYRNIVDPNNFTKLYDLFTLQASKDDLANYVKTFRR